MDVHHLLLCVLARSVGACAVPPKRLALSVTHEDVVDVDHWGPAIVLCVGHGDRANPRGFVGQGVVVEDASGVFLALAELPRRRNSVHCKLEGGFACGGFWRLHGYS